MYSSYMMMILSGVYDMVYMIYIYNLYTYIIMIYIIWVYMIMEMILSGVRGCVKRE